MGYAQVIAQYLSDLGVGVYNQAGGNVFTHPVLPPSGSVPAKAVFVFPRPGGRQPSRMHDGTEIRYPVMTVRIRGNVDGYTDGQSFADLVFDTLEAAKLSGYIDTQCQQSQAAWIGYDSSGHPEWSIAVELWIESTY